VYPLLTGVRILDLGRLIMADHASQLLADLGADVIKIEGPPEGDYLRGLPPIRNGVSSTYLQYNRNKRSISLNLKLEEGRAIFFELLKTADAVMQLSKPGTFAKLGLDYESLSKKKPDLVYTEMSAFGQTGPWKSLPAHGYNMLATSARVSVEWSASGRPEFGSNNGAKGGGGAIGVTAALATMAALVQKERTGRGQYLDVSFWDEMVSTSPTLLATLNDFEPMMEKLDIRNAPRYNLYRTSDDRVIFIGPIERHFWKAFCVAVGREEWIGRAKFELPMDHGNYDVTLRDEIQEILGQGPLDHWMDLFTSAGVPAAPVILSDEDLAEQPHTVERQMVVHTEHPEYGPYASVRPGFKMPGHDFVVKWAPPMRGDHTAEVLGELGYGEEELMRLHDSGVV
jgi:crotonobetainyl-CoA:carnitine CoA-transferase CaiB-like acyl-CoA transferase